MPNRRTFLGLLGSSIAWLYSGAKAQDAPPPQGNHGGRGGGGGGGGGGGRGGRQRDYLLPEELKAYGLMSLVLGRVSDRSVTVSALAAVPMEGYFEYGTSPGKYTLKTKLLTFAPGTPVEANFNELKPNTLYYYRLQSRATAESNFAAQEECHFHTQRAPGSSFIFSIQGDSHPERPQMSDPALYARTLLNVAADKPDFHICMGDDFSVARLRTINDQTLAQPYTLQRPFLGLVAQSAPLFLLNGNHEQASLFNFNQSDIRHEVAVGAQKARNRFYPTPSPDAFYSGDEKQFASIGLLKDYYSWTWGDALFVVLDNYWQSPAQVDTGFQNFADVRHDRDWWALTLGDEQYHWFKRTLENSSAKYKFVFAHHVMGSGRGGVDECDLWEWGGRNKRGDWEFNQRRPNWEMPVHQLMVKHGVTIFFQGHDHLFARQEKDGIVYQEVPMPADQGYVTYNDDRYESGVKLPNSGHLRVSVTPEDVTVEYVRCFLPKDETAEHKTGQIAHRYTVQAKQAHA